MRYILLIAFALVISGCSTQPKYNKLDVQPVKHVYVSIPESLVSPCNPDKPMSKEEYLALKPHEREEYLTNYSIRLLGVIKSCNLQLKSISELNKQAK